MELVVTQERSEALVMRGVDFSETSRIVTFLTPGRGLVTCLAKGARRKNSPLTSALDTFNRVELVYYWKDSRAVQNLGEVSVLDTWRPLKADLAKGAYAAFAFEIAQRAAQENAPSEELFQALVGGLGVIAAWPGDPSVPACWLALAVLREAGLAPEMQVCMKTGAVVSGACGFRFDGGVVAAGQACDRRLSAETRSALAALVESAGACPEIGDCREVFTLVRRYAMHQLECDLRSARVIDQLFPS
jgi:DNA repair protein RecO (recombination protein O)